MSAYWTSSISIIPFSAQRAKDPSNSKFTLIPSHLAVPVEPPPAVVELSTIKYPLVTGEAVPPAVLETKTLTLQPLPDSDSQPPTPRLPVRASVERDTDSAHDLGPEPETQRRDSESDFRNKVDQDARLYVLKESPRPCLLVPGTKNRIFSDRWLSRSRSVSAYRSLSPFPSRLRGLESKGRHKSLSLFTRARRACTRSCPLWLGFLTTSLLVGALLLAALHCHDYALISVRLYNG